MLSQGKKRHRDETSRLAEQDQQLLRQENERLQVEVRRAREDLLQSSAAKALEQENTALKRELAAQKELSSVRMIHTPKRSPVGHVGAAGSGSLCFQSCAGGQGHVQLESLQQENEALKTQMSRLSTHLIDVRMFPFLPGHVGLLPGFNRLNEGVFSRRCRLSSWDCCPRRLSGCRGCRIPGTTQRTPRYKSVLFSPLSLLLLFNTLGAWE